MELADVTFLLCLTTAASLLFSDRAEVWRALAKFELKF